MKNAERSNAGVVGILTIIRSSCHAGCKGAIGAPGTTPPVRLILRSLEAYPAPFESSAIPYTVDPSGDFVFPSVLEGHYSVNATALPANSYIADVRLAGRSVFDEGFVVGELSGVLEVRVSSKGARIQGTVLDLLRKPVPTARIVLVPRENQGGSWRNVCLPLMRARARADTP